MFYIDKTKTNSNAGQSPGKLLIEKSSGNIFVDLGFSAAELVNLSLRSECMMALQQWFRYSGFTQASAAKQLDVSQPRFNALMSMAALAGLAVELSLKRRGVIAASATKLVGYRNKLCKGADVIGLRPA